MNKKVWVLLATHIEDSQVLGVFSSLKKLDEHIKKEYNAEINDIEYFSLGEDSGWDLIGQAIELEIDVPVKQGLMY